MARIIVNVFFLLQPWIVSLVTSMVVTTPSTNSRKMTVTITLQFDGSFGPPKDPGFATLSRKLAIGAACLCMNVITNENVEKNEKTLQQFPLAVAAKAVSVSVGMSSQQTEYEGLLLGLELLLNDWSSWIEKLKTYCEEDNTASGITRRSPQNNDVAIRILVQGDCKTVLDQLSGKAVSRKLQAENGRAKDLLEQIILRSNLSGDRGNNPPSVEYQLLPRTKNLICDNICRNFATIVAVRAWTACLYDLKLLIEQNQQAIHVNSGLTVKDVLQKHLDPSTSLIKYSLRPCLYETLANIAEECGDYHSMINIGKRLWQEPLESFTDSTMARKGSTGRPPCKTMKRRSVSLQVEGWLRLGHQKKANYLFRKYHTLLHSSGKTATSMEWSLQQTRRDLGRDINDKWDPGIPTFWKVPLCEWFVEATKSTNDDATSYFHYFL